MHLDYWEINRSPFASQLDPDDYYPSSAHEEALARIEFLIANHRRVGFLLGASGTGKSLLLEVAAKQLRRTGEQVVRINAVGLSGAEFVWKLANGLGYHAKATASVLECWHGTADRIAANRYQRVGTIIMVDDADEAEPEVHAALSRLALLDQHPEARLTVLLAAQRQRASSFGSKLNDLCELRIDMEPWDGAETAEYVRLALQRAGAQRAIFTPDGIDQLQELSHGLPRRVRQLAELSLLAGAAEGLEHVTGSVVASVYRGLTAGGIAEAA